MYVVFVYDILVYIVNMYCAICYSACITIQVVYILIVCNAINN